MVANSIGGLSRVVLRGREGDWNGEVATGVEPHVRHSILSMSVLIAVATGCTGTSAPLSGTTSPSSGTSSSSSDWRTYRSGGLLFYNTAPTQIYALSPGVPV